MSKSDTQNRNLQDLEQIIGYRFKDGNLLKTAMIHSSTGADVNYERLEFLGDRVLGLAMAHLLFETFPKEKEGGLAKRHAALVQGSTLAVIATMNGLGDFVRLSASEKAAGGADNENILADVMEALLGAVYLDGGLSPAEELVRRLWGDNVHTMVEAPLDPKTELQEWAQARGLPLPAYEIAGREGPDHAPLFEIEVSVEGLSPCRAQGPSRRQAEKTAARLMLKALKKNTPRKGGRT